MKNLLQGLKSSGANETTINVILIMFSAFLFIVGTATVVVIVYDVIKGIAFQPAIISILSILVAASGGLIAVSHTTTTINGTAAQTALAANNVTTQNTDAMANVITQVVQAILASQSQADSHSLEIAKVNTLASKEVVENTKSLDANTAATEQNTQTSSGGALKVINGDLRNG